MDRFESIISADAGLRESKPIVRSDSTVRTEVVSEPRSVAEQVAHDLDVYVSRSSGVEKQRKLNLISKKIGVHSKTLNRICLLENKPSYITVFKIYKYILNENDDSKVLELCPPLIRDYLRKANPQTLEKSVSYSEDVELEVRRNTVALELFVLCATGELSLLEVKEKFGTYGVATAQKLLAKQILREVKPEVFSLGSLQMNMSPETVVQMGLQMTSSYAKPQNGYEKGKHYHAFYAEGLTAEAFEQWLRIDETAFAQKIQIAKESGSLGSIRAYTFQSTDTLENKDAT